MGGFILLFYFFIFESRVLAREVSLVVSFFLYVQSVLKSTYLIFSSPQSGEERIGRERSGEEWSGEKRSGEEKSGVERIGSKRSIEKTRGDKRIREGLRGAERS